MKILSACEKTLRTQEKSLVASVTTNHIIALQICFHALLGVVDRSDFISSVVIHVSLWKNKFLPSENYPCHHVTVLSYQSIKYLMC